VSELNTLTPIPPTMTLTPLSPADASTDALAPTAMAMDYIRKAYPAQAQALAAQSPAWALLPPSDSLSAMDDYLHIAAALGDTARVAKFLDANRDRIDVLDAHGKTALCVAIETEAVEPVRLLLARGAEPFMPIKKDAGHPMTPVLIACARSGSPAGMEIFDAVIDAADPEELRKSQGYGHDALRAVAASGCSQALRRLIDIYSTTADWRFALREEAGGAMVSAASRKDPEGAECLRALIPLTPPKYVIQPDSVNLLMTCASEGSPESMALLLPHIDPKEGGRNDYTPLMRAAIRRDALAVEIVKVLLPVSDSNAQSKSGITALMNCARVRNWGGGGGKPAPGAPIAAAIAEALMPSSNLALVDEDGNNALELALRQNKPESRTLVLQTLLRHWPQSDLLDPKHGGRDILEHAADNGEWANVEELAPFWPIEKVRDVVALARETDALDEIPRSLALAESHELAQTVSSAQNPSGVDDGDAEGATPNRRPRAL